MLAGSRHRFLFRRGADAAGSTGFELATTATTPLPRPRSEEASAIRGSSVNPALRTIADEASGTGLTDFREEGLPRYPADGAVPARSTSWSAVIANGQDVDSAREKTPTSGRVALW